jgi:chromosome segregation ATPase
MWMPKKKSCQCIIIIMQFSADVAQMTAMMQTGLPYGRVGNTKSVPCNIGNTLNKVLPEFFNTPTMTDEAIVSVMATRIKPLVKIANVLVNKLSKHPEIKIGGNQGQTFANRVHEATRVNGSPETVVQDVVSACEVMTKVYDRLISTKVISDRTVLAADRVMELINQSCRSGDKSCENQITNILGKLAIIAEVGADKFSKVTLGQLESGLRTKIEMLKETTAKLQEAGKRIAESNSRLKAYNEEKQTMEERIKRLQTDIDAYERRMPEKEKLLNQCKDAHSQLAEKAKAESTLLAESTARVAALEQELKIAIDQLKQKQLSNGQRSVRIKQLEQLVDELQSNTNSPTIKAGFYDALKNSSSISDDDGVLERCALEKAEIENKLRMAIEEMDELKAQVQGHGGQIEKMIKDAREEQMKLQEQIDHLSGAYANSDKESTRLRQELNTELGRQQEQVDDLTRLGQQKDEVIEKLKLAEEDYIQNAKNKQALITETGNTLQNLQNEVNELLSAREQVVSNNNRYVEQVRQLQTQLSHYENEVQSKENELRKKTDELAHLRQNISDFQEKNQLQKQNADAVRHRQAELETQIRNGNDELTRIKEMLESSEQNLLEKTSELERLRGEQPGRDVIISELEANLAGMVDNHERLQHEFELAKRTIADNEIELANLRSQFQNFETKTGEAVIAPLKSRIAVLEAESRKLDTEKSALEKKINEMGKTLEQKDKDSHTQIQQYKAQLASRETELIKLNENLSMVQSNANDLQNQLDSKMGNSAGLQRQLDATQATIAKLERERDAASTQVRELQSRISTFDDITATLEAAKDELRKTKDELRKKMDEYNEIKSAMNRGQTDFAAKIAQSEWELQQSKETLDIKTAQLEELTVKMGRYIPGTTHTAELERVQREKDAARVDFERKIDAMNDDLDQMRQQLEQASPAGCGQELEESKQTIDTLQNELSESQHRETQLQQQIADLLAKIEELQRVVDEAQASGDVTPRVLSDIIKELLVLAYEFINVVNRIKSIKDSQQFELFLGNFEKDKSGILLKQIISDKYEPANTLTGVITDLETNPDADTAAAKTTITQIHRDFMADVEQLLQDIKDMIGSVFSFVIVHDQAVNSEFKTTWFNADRIRNRKLKTVQLSQNHGDWVVGENGRPPQSFKLTNVVKSLKDNSFVSMKQIFNDKTVRATLNVVNSVQKSIVIFGYGYSGSGKTYVLIDKNNQNKVRQTNIMSTLIHAATTGHDVNAFTNTPLPNPPAFVKNRSVVQLVNAFELYGQIDVTTDDSENYHEAFRVGLGKGGTMTRKTGILNTISGIIIHDFNSKEMVFDQNNSKDLKTLYNLLDKIDTFRTQNTPFRVVATPNNPVSSRSHLFLIFKVYGNGTRDRYIIISDCGGMENPIDMGRLFENDENKYVQNIVPWNHVKYIEETNKRVITCKNSDDKCLSIGVNYIVETGETVSINGNDAHRYTDGEQKPKIKPTFSIKDKPNVDLYPWMKSSATTSNMPKWVNDGNGDFYKVVSSLTSRLEGADSFAHSSSYHVLDQVRVMRIITCQGLFINETLIGLRTFFQMKKSLTAKQREDENNPNLGRIIDKVYDYDGQVPGDKIGKGFFQLFQENDNEQYSSLRPLYTKKMMIKALTYDMNAAYPAPTGSTPKHTPTPSPSKVGMKKTPTPPSPKKQGGSAVDADKQADRRVDKNMDLLDRFLEARCIRRHSHTGSQDGQAPLADAYAGRYNKHTNVVKKISAMDNDPVGMITLLRLFEGLSTNTRYVMMAMNNLKGQSGAAGVASCFKFAEQCDLVVE